MGRNVLSDIKSSMAWIVSSVGRDKPLRNARGLDSAETHGILHYGRREGMRQFTITDVIEGNGQPHPTFTHDASYPVLDVLSQGSASLPGFLVADDQGRFHLIRMDHCRLCKIEAP
jgi:hypothetical protein